MCAQVHRIYIREKALVKMLDHVMESVPEGLQLTGFLVGTDACWEGTRYSVAEEAITTDLDVTDPESWNREGLDPMQVRRRVEEAAGGSGLVGWYHSHPDMEIAFTRDDVRLHMRLFPRGGGVGMVLDPVDMDMRCFAPRRSGMPREVSYAVI